MSDHSPASPESSDVVLFVCEHGVAKSLLAKLMFERYAREAGLPMRAEARATAPDAALPAWMLDGLRAKELDAGAFAPRALATSDVEGAACVVSFDLPEVADSAASCGVGRAQWDAVPMASRDFDASHAAIEARVRVLVESLARDRQRTRQ